MVDVRYLIYGLVDKNGSLYEMIVADNDDKAIDLFKNVILTFIKNFDVNNEEQVSLFKNEILYSKLCLICAIPVLNVLDDQVLTINKPIHSVVEFIINNVDLFDDSILDLICEYKEDFIDE